MLRPITSTAPVFAKPLLQELPPDVMQTMRTAWLRARQEDLVDRMAAIKEELPRVSNKAIRAHYETKLALMQKELLAVVAERAMADDSLGAQ